MFEFLENLYNGDVDFQWVINHFSDGTYDGTSNTHVTLNKYLNALKIFGVKVKKVNNKYHMHSPLFKIKLDLKDIKSISILKKACTQLPDGKNKLLCKQFLKELEIRYDETAKRISQVENSIKNLNLDFYHSELVAQVKLCEQYCQDQRKLELIYTDDRGNEINLLGSPIETVYIKRKVYLRVAGTNGSRIYDIPIENIISLRQLHNSATNNLMPTTIVYRIKNRLAKNYKLRDWEKLQNIEADGSKIVVNKNEDFNLFLARLMRYGTDCEIISPKFIKDEMIDIINKTLSNYL